MGKKIIPMEKIMQRSIGFNLRQILFFANNPEFKPDIFCRAAVDEQIELLEQKEYLKEESLK